MELEIKKVIDNKINNNFIEKEVEKNLREKVKSMINQEFYGALDKFISR